MLVPHHQQLLIAGLLQCPRHDSGRQPGCARNKGLLHPGAHHRRCPQHGHGKRGQPVDPRQEQIDQSWRHAATVGHISSIQKLLGVQRVALAALEQAGPELGIRVRAQPLSGKESQGRLVERAELHHGAVRRSRHVPDEVPGRVAARNVFGPHRGQQHQPSVHGVREGADHVARAGLGPLQVLENHQDRALGDPLGHRADHFGDVAGRRLRTELAHRLHDRSLGPLGGDVQAHTDPDPGSQPAGALRDGAHQGALADPGVSGDDHDRRRAGQRGPHRLLCCRQLPVPAQERRGPCHHLTARGVVPCHHRTPDDDSAPAVMVGCGGSDAPLAHAAQVDLRVARCE